MHRALAWTAAVALAFAGTGAVAGEPNAPSLRDDVAALVGWVPDGRGYERVPEGPSPTALVTRIVAVGDGKLRPEMKTLWRLATAEGTKAAERRAAVEETIRFLYGTADPQEPALRVADGAVLAYPPKQGNFNFGSMRDLVDPPAKAVAPAFDAIVKGGKLRATPHPQAPKLVEALQKPDVATWGTAARESLARAAGESATGANAAKLVQLATQQPTDPALATALAWSAAPEAEAELRGRVASLAARVASGKEAAAPLLASAAAGLAHVKLAALLEEMDKLEGPARAAAVTAAGPRIALRYALDRAKKAGAEGRADALPLLATAASDRAGEVAPADAAAYVAFLDECTREPSLRDEALRAAENFLYAFHRYPIHNSSNMNGISETIEGESVGPYPSIESALAAFAPELASGGVRFVAARTNLFDEPAAAAGERWAALAGLRTPFPNRPAPPEKTVGALAGEIVPEGLRLTLTNTSKVPLAVAAPLLRIGVGEVTKTRLQAGTDGKPKDFTNLKIGVGFVRASLEVPAEKLVTIAPGAAHVWTIPLREADRAVDHVSVECTPMFEVAGAKPAGTVTVLAGFDETWVR